MNMSVAPRRDTAGDRPVAVTRCAFGSFPADSTRVLDRNPLPGARQVTNAPLAALAGGALARRFHAWRGVSGRRYIFTVYPIGAAQLPELTDAVVIAAGPGCAGEQSIRMIGDSGDVPLLPESEGVRRAQRAGAIELHFHVLAATPQARRDVIRDLSPGGSAVEFGHEPGECGILQAEFDEMTMGGAHVVGVVA